MPDPELQQYKGPIMGDPQIYQYLLMVARVGTSETNMDDPIIVTCDTEEIYTTSDKLIDYINWFGNLGWDLVSTETIPIHSTSEDKQSFILYHFKRILLPIPG